MPKCSVCKTNYELPDGLTFVHVDGRILHFCSSKCRKNYKMGRKKLKWVTKQKGIGKLEVEEESAKAGVKEKPAEIKEEKKAEAKPNEEKKEENKTEEKK